MSELQPSFDFFGIVIQEPTTVLTDLLISGVCFYAYLKLYNEKRPEKSFHLLHKFFLVMGIATSVSGLVGHGFLYAFGVAWKLPGWLTSILSIWFLERASIEHANGVIPFVTLRWLRFINVLELIFFLGATLYYLDFFLVELYTAFGLFVVNLPIQIFIMYRARNDVSRLFIQAILLTLLSAVIFKIEISFGIWFNHLDVSHVVIAFAIYTFYISAKNYKIPVLNKK